MVRHFLPAVFLVLTGALACAQVPQAPAKPLTRNVEPGLEQAVKWRWTPVPSDGPAWGETPPMAPRPVATPVQDMSTPTPQSTYEVKKGDVLVVIARRFGLSAVHLKKFNNLETDMIRIGQMLNIPTPDQARAIAPLPADIQKANAAKKEKKDPATEQRDTLILQIFLDREGFSAGPIDGKPDATLTRVAELYQANHPDASTPEALLQKAKSVVGNDIFGQYTLRPEDYEFIMTPKAQRVEAAAPVGTKPRTTTAYDALISAPMLAYRGPWEFVAERFHCDEVFLRSINPEIQTVPQAGTTFRVPRVMPFAIEGALRQPLQPAPNSAYPVTAAIEDLSLLKIRRGEELVAVVPVTSARPGLRGRGTWTILNAIPRPRLETRQEPTAAATPAPRLYGAAETDPQPAPTPLLEPQYLAAGPNNPAGIIWINLAKSDSTEPLPYGLHGTSIPDQVKQYDSIGGFRMANWNIARVARLLPVGTSLVWTQAVPVPIAPANGSGTVPVAPAQIVTPADRAVQDAFVVPDPSPASTNTPPTL